MIHPTADVAGDARVGRDTVVWHGAQVREGAVVGDECVIGKDVYIDAHVVVGDRVKIQNGALLYRGVTVADGVFIGPGAILTNDRHPRAIRADGGRMTADDWAIDEIHLGYGCSIGAGAVVVAGRDVGRFAMVGAGAVVTRTVPDHALVAGNPARRTGWVCRCGQGLADGAGVPMGAHGSGAAVCPMDGRRYAIEEDHCAEEVASA